MTVSISGTGGVTFPDNSAQTTAATGFGFKNRLINGAMVIDQRNAGAVTTPTAGVYTLDRWQFQLAAAGKFSVQRSTSAPAGFSNSLVVTSLGAYSVLSTDYFTAQYNIEGFNFADMNWGGANAQAVMLSFWVNCSLTGTFTGAFRNAANTRTYPYSYTISAANTWQYISIKVTGDTTGTWVGATNGTGVQVFFDFGSGATNQGTAGAWANGTSNAATGQTNLLATSGATFYITGVQLEKGSTATSFDYRPYGTELALCQRYAFQMNASDGGNTANRFALGFSNAVNKAFCQMPHPVPMRVKPSLTTSVSTLNLSDAITGSVLTAVSIQTATSDINKTCFDCTTAGGLTTFRPYYLEANTSSCTVLLSAEL